MLVLCCFSNMKSIIFTVMWPTLQGSVLATTNLGTNTAAIVLNIMSTLGGAVSIFFNSALNLGQVPRVPCDCDSDREE